MSRGGQLDLYKETFSSSLETVYLKEDLTRHFPD